MPGHQEVSEPHLTGLFQVLSPFPKGMYDSSIFLTYVGSGWGSCRCKSSQGGTKVALIILCNFEKEGSHNLANCWCMHGCVLFDIF